MKNEKDIPHGFKQLAIEDKEVFDRYLHTDPPVISELTFTNLFIWRQCHNPVWMEREDCLLIALREKSGPMFGLPPTGLGDKTRALDFLAEQLRLADPNARISRVPEIFVEQFVDYGKYEVLPDRNNSDYVYRSDDLINLPGRKYHRKKNHLNKFLKTYTHEYHALDEELLKYFLDMQEQWCQLKDCKTHPDLLEEDYAVYQALTHLRELDYQGGAIIIDGRVEAFALGEPLNENTAVIHIEKANQEISGIYAAINQLFCLHAWAGMEYINREQDLGIEGLRKAKESYAPHHLVNKYTLVPKGIK